MKKILASISESIHQIGVVYFVLSLAFLSLFAISSVFGWTEPTQSPPDGNVSLPINSGNTTQYKIGAIGIGGLFHAYSDAIFDGSVNIGGGLTVGGTTVISSSGEWTGSQTGLIGPKGDKGDPGAVGSSERIVQKVTRNIYSTCSTPNNDILQCTRDMALSNFSSDVEAYGSADCHPVRIECSMEYTTDSSNSIQIELNDPSNTYWECADFYLYDYCGDADGCKIIYYGFHKTDGNDQVRILPSYIFMEQPGWSANLRSGVYGFNRQDGGEIAFNTGVAGETFNIIQPWAWGWMTNYRFNGCGGDNTAFADPYNFRFTTHPSIHSKFIIYDK